MSRHLHVANLVGRFFWSTPLPVNIDEFDAASQAASRARLELIGYNSEKKHGTFAFGPLGGIFVITDSPQPPHVSEFDATRIYLDSSEHPVIKLVES